MIQTQYIKPHFDVYCNVSSRTHKFHGSGAAAMNSLTEKSVQSAVCKRMSLWAPEKAEMGEDYITISPT